MGKGKVDYSLYLVTDATPAILGDKDLVGVVEAAIAGGVTVVQYREKTGDTAELVWRHFPSFHLEIYAGRDHEELTYHIFRYPLLENFTPSPESMIFPSS